jgi:hypothetical protein
MELAGRDVSQGLYYSLTRSGKVIEGPNVRLAEIIAHTYGNCRVGARSLGEDESGKSVIAEAVFHDLESNTAIRMQSKRRITTKEGYKFQDDMVMVTENAACAIAFRNVVLKGVPKALWGRLYAKARKATGGTTKDETAEKRKQIIEVFKKFKVPDANVLERVGAKSMAALTSDQVATLVGCLTAIKNGETTWWREFKFGEVKREPASEVVDTGASGAITQDQVLDVFTLLGDAGLKSASDLRKLLDGMGFKGDITTLPKYKLKALHAEIAKRAKK